MKEHFLLQWHSVISPYVLVHTNFFLKLCSNPFLQPTSTEQWVYIVLFNERTGAFDWFEFSPDKHPPITSQAHYPLRHADPRDYYVGCLW